MRITIGNNVTIQQKDNSLEVQYYKDFTETESRDITVARIDKGQQLCVISEDVSIDFTPAEVEHILPSLLSIFIRSKNDYIEDIVQNI